MRSDPTLAKLPRLHVDGALTSGVPVFAGPGPAHYLRSVLRLGADAQVRLFNGRDGEWLARLGPVTKSRAELMPIRPLRPQTGSPDLWLAFAPVKKAAIDAIVEKATELGAARLLPVLTERTDVARVNLERLRAHAVEAAEQCERLEVPELAEPVALPKLLAGWPEGRPLIVCAEAGSARPLATVIGGLVRDGSPPGPAGLLIGPEGGFAQSELDALRDLPFVHPAGLGPRVLRADTAAVAALALWQGLAGDAADRPPHR